MFKVFFINGPVIISGSVVCNVFIRRKDVFNFRLSLSQLHSVFQLSNPFAIICFIGHGRGEKLDCGSPKKSWGVRNFDTIKLKTRIPRKSVETFSKN